MVRVRLPAGPGHGAAAHAVDRDARAVGELAAPVLVRDQVPLPLLVQRQGAQRIVADLSTCRRLEILGEMLAPPDNCSFCMADSAVMDEQNEPNSEYQREFPITSP